MSSRLKSFFIIGDRPRFLSISGADHGYFSKNSLGLSPIVTVNEDLAPATILGDEPKALVIFPVCNSSRIAHEIFVRANVGAARHATLAAKRQPSVACPCAATGWTKPRESTMSPCVSEPALHCLCCVSRPSVEAQFGFRSVRVHNVYQLFKQ